MQVLQIAVAARPTSAALYAALAECAYKAHNTRVGDLAAAKAVSLAPAAERRALKNELAKVRKNPSGEKTYDDHDDGKTYVGKLTPKANCRRPKLHTPRPTTPRPRKNSPGAASWPAPRRPRDARRRIRAGEDAPRYTARLLIGCADRPGIVAAVSGFLFERGANIVSSHQYSSDPSGGRFFLRTEFFLEDRRSSPSSASASRRSFAAEVAGAL